MSAEPTAHSKELCPEISVAGEQIKNLKEWQVRQNGDIAKICKRIDWLFYIAITALCSTLTAIVVMLLQRTHVP